MNDIPWFALSPSPFTLLFYLILVFWGMNKLLKNHSYKRFSRVLAFTDSIFILGLVVLFLDTIWIVFSGLRFGALYPDSILQLVYTGGRNIAGMILCFMLIGSHFKAHLLRISKRTCLLFILNMLFLSVWFGLARSPAFTDWTFAIRYDYPVSVVTLSFFISHVIGKSLVTAIFFSVWNT